MADAANTEVTKSGDANVETVPVEVAKATNEAVEKAMAQVTQLVESIAKAAEPTETQPEGDGEADVSKADGEGDAGDGGENTEVDTEKGITKAEKEMRGQMREKLEKEMAKKGMKGDMLKGAVDVAMRTLAGQGAFKPGKETQPPLKKGGDMKKTEKNTDGGGDDGAQAAIDPAAGVQETLKAIQQGLAGASHATQTQEAVKAAIAALQDLEKAMSMQSIAPNSSPSTTVPTSPMYGASGIKDITKALEGIKDALAGVQEVTKSLGERVEDIEKTRQPSTSEDGTDGTTTNTVKKSMWSGVL